MARLVTMHKQLDKLVEATAVAVADRSADDQQVHCHIRRIACWCTCILVRSQAMLIHAAGFVTCEQQAGDTWGPAAQPGVRKGVLVVTVAAEVRQLLSTVR